MSSTDEKRLAKFWRDHLAPAAARLAARGAEPLDRGSSGSSWSDPPRDVPDLAELPVAELEALLTARLESAGLQELADIVPELMRLAAQLRPSHETAEEIDPFVYVMH
jgi:hypothetical protein